VTTHGGHLYGAQDTTGKKIKSRQTRRTSCTADHGRQAAAAAAAAAAGGGDAGCLEPFTVGHHAPLPLPLLLVFMYLLHRSFSLFVTFLQPSQSLHSASSIASSVHLMQGFYAMNDLCSLS
jgi:hypothetical protein